MTLVHASPPKMKGTIVVLLTLSVANIIISLSLGMERQVSLPTICHKRDSIQNPRAGEKGFQCRPDGCNQCSDCSCDEEGNLGVSGFCSLVGCDPFFSSCEEFNSKRRFLIHPDSDTFGCYDGCNYCNECTCDGRNTMTTGGTCTFRQCLPGTQDVPQDLFLALQAGTS